MVVPIRGQPYTARKAIRSGRLRHVAVGDRCIRILYSPWRIGCRRLSDGRQRNWPGAALRRSDESMVMER